MEGKLFYQNLPEHPRTECAANFPVANNLAFTVDYITYPDVRGFTKKAGFNKDIRIKDE